MSTIVRVRRSARGSLTAAGAQQVLPVGWSQRERRSQEQIAGVASAREPRDSQTGDISCLLRRRLPATPARTSQSSQVAVHLQEAGRAQEADDTASTTLGSRLDGPLSESCASYLHDRCPICTLPNPCERHPMEPQQQLGCTRHWGVAGENARVTGVDDTSASSRRMRCGIREARRFRDVGNGTLGQVQVTEATAAPDVHAGSLSLQGQQQAVCMREHQWTPLESVSVGVADRVPVANEHKVDDDVCRDAQVDDCPICLAPLIDQVAKTRCHHHFHVDCLDQHLRSCAVDQPTCPLCRSKIRLRLPVTAEASSGRSIKVLHQVPQEGGRCHLDRAYTFLSLGDFGDKPRVLYLLTSNEDKWTPIDSIMWTLMASVPTTVYLNFRSARHVSDAGVATWLEAGEWKLCEMASTVTTGFPNGPYEGPVFSKNFEVGAIELMGSSCQEGAYFVFVELRGDAAWDLNSALK